MRVESSPRSGGRTRSAIDRFSPHSISSRSPLSFTPRQPGGYDTVAAPFLLLVLEANIGTIVSRTSRRTRTKQSRSLRPGGTKDGGRWCSRRAAKPPDQEMILVRALTWREKLSSHRQAASTACRTGLDTRAPSGRRSWYSAFSGGFTTGYYLAVRPGRMNAVLRKRRKCPPDSITSEQPLHSRSRGYQPPF